jgi:hypothetical protein
MKQNQFDIVDGVVKSLVETTSVRTFFVGLHNAFAHGEIMTEIGLDFSDKELGEMFDHFEGLVKIAKKIEEENGL